MNHNHCAVLLDATATMCIGTKYVSNLASEFAHEGHYFTITSILDDDSILRAMIGDHHEASLP
jgi:hypothetical protein